jgi:hypothetical protein
MTYNIWANIWHNSYVMSHDITTTTTTTTKTTTLHGTGKHWICLYIITWHDITWMNNLTDSTVRQIHKLDGRKRSVSLGTEQLKHNKLRQYKSSIDTVRRNVARRLRIWSVTYLCRQPHGFVPISLSEINVKTQTRRHELVQTYSHRECKQHTPLWEVSSTHNSQLCVYIYNIQYNNCIYLFIGWV